jgi:hypothetical protein
MSPVPVARAFGFEPDGDSLVLRLGRAHIGFPCHAAWNPNPSLQHRTSPYPLPIRLTLGMSDNEHTASRFSPPPFAIIVQGDCVQALVQVTADPGWHRWNQVEFAVSRDEVVIRIDLEGQSSPGEAARHVRGMVTDDEGGMQPIDLLASGIALAYPQARATAARPDWWLRPSHCGWGDQTTTCMQLEGPGEQCRAMAYCIQGLYERWIGRLHRLQVPVGTVIIDAGWSPAGWWKPDQVRWPDLRGFIDRQHQAGRRVVLWLATWLWEGLPDEWCLFVDGCKLSCDPTHPRYREHLRQCVHELLSPNGFNADGFKIDQLSFCPDRRAPIGGSRFGWCSEFPPATQPIRLAQGDLWGCELLHLLQSDIYRAAKEAKPDALITSSTVHPYFAGTFDMVRLHDMGRVAVDIFAAMQARADLARATLPGFPIDADDWIHSDYDLWRTYTAGSGRLGVPCTFYAENFVLNWSQHPLTRPIDDQDLLEIAKQWRRYLAALE